MAESKGKNNNWRERERGALWKKNNFYTGKITLGDKTMDVIAFPNDKATEENNQPSFHIYESEEYQGNGGSKTSSKQEDPPELLQ